MLKMKTDYSICREESVCFTGHREIPSSDVPSVRRSIAEAVSLAYGEGYRTFICGGARGFDTLAAQEVIRFRARRPDTRLILALPCASQADRWPYKDREEYRAVLEKADQVCTLSEKYYNGCMQYRNRFMVDHASLCLCYLLRFKGGTWSTVRYALHQGVALKNLAMNGNETAILRESTWNSIYIFHSVSENAHTVHLSPSPLQRFRWTNTLKRLSGKRK